MSYFDSNKLPSPTRIRLFFVLVYIMSDLSDLKDEELRMIARARNVGGYENMSRQQLETKFKSSSASISAPVPAPILNFKPRPAPRFTPSLRVQDQN